MQHGGDIYTAHTQQPHKQILDFSANINPLGMPDCVRQALVQALDTLGHYPDPQQRELRQALAAYHGVQMQHVLCGNGGADLIFRTISALQPHAALIPVPTFSEYGKALREVGCTVEEYPMESPDFVLTATVLSALRTGAYDFLALCNPNNPTGALLPKQLLEEILRTAQAHHVFVLLDECFYDMVGTPSDSMSMIPQYRQYDNLLILKSMTKRYAIPGLRLGYGICGNDRIAACIQQTGQPWSVSTLAAAAGIAAVQAEAERQAFLRFLQPERQFLYQALRKLGFTVWQPHANFIFFHAKAFPDLEQRLLPYGILLRSCASYAGLDATYYRTAVRTREENLYLLACLNEIVEGGGTCTQNPL